MGEIGILTVSECTDGALDAISAELLGAARKLADELGQKVATVIIGSGVGDAGKDAVAYGADEVYVADDAKYANYQPEAYAAVVQQAAKDLSPAIILAGQTSIGRDLAPRVAFKLQTGLSTDCISLKLDAGRMIMSRAVYGGNAMADYVSESDPQMATVRVKSQEALAKDDSRSGDVKTIAADADIKTAFIEKVTEEVTGIKLEDADVVVCGGRGIGSEEGFEPLNELAKMLHGAVGATRPPCDNGWIASTQQIGLTGKIVSPTLYFGIALSGASQHIAGCSGAKNIVAINKDDEANIFNVAHYGVVGDYKKILPALIAKVKELG
ncbi:MAG: electron transfer flavoprotein subunit alpha/FixB family protein [Chloroflexi bacterium]|jgi:electron transfer flavoprotein alpha subunit|nr:electron transfer flavoprotein subunit alpha/FixB family protein [Chloroflexota bacterium]MBT7081555.1 electron transfer flavoprotein subunit alpha/FixB family protein [Chloroflexota bacterium]MBT7289023.1 electron transfer flavoprotein subunit alpha/FixB family protein [Chloroflexota bacterium]